ncbi:MAG: efflux transporter outer membrane subunit [Thermodesulfobacteriota bacterium]|nr:efflux transporter outer membrane subunit [Thermodesulfobacteriota bacterium]
MTKEKLRRRVTMKPLHSNLQKARWGVVLQITGWTLILALFTSGCIKMGKDYQRPDMDFTVPDAWEHPGPETVPENPSATDAPYRWWRVFNNPDLDRFVEAVIANNHDIQKAAAGILEARANLGITRADRLPAVNLSLEAERTRKTRAATLPGMNRTTDNYTVSLPAAFELDLWGRLARAEEAARAKLLATETARDTVMNTVIAESVSLYLQHEAAKQRLQVARQRLQNRAKFQKLIQSRYTEGLITSDGLHQARIAVNQAEAAVLAVKRDIAGIQQQLCVLAGEYPKTDLSDMAMTDNAVNDGNLFSRLEPVQAGLPSDLLRRRPDIRSAEASLQALNATVGAAKAARFPRISLTGAFGYANSELDDLLTPESEFWNIAAGITRPLFDAGRLKAAHQAANARYEQGVQSYAQTVLKAFAEVENGLFNRENYLETRNRQVNTLEAARATYENATHRYNGGISSLTDVLSTEQSYLDARENLILTELALVTNRVSLERALGGAFSPPTATGDTAANGT